MTEVVPFKPKAKVEEEAEEATIEELMERIKGELLRGQKIITISYNIPLKDGAYGPPDISIMGRFPGDPILTGALVYYLKKYLDSEIAKVYTS